MRKHKDWCTENDAAHAWKGQEQFDRFPKEGGIRVARSCENCGLTQTSTVITPDWETER